MTIQSLRHRQRAAGFTLIEMLAVIGIIAILLGILIPTVSHVRRQANQAKCLANLRSLATAVVSYCHDNDDKFFTPATVTWHPSDWIYWQPGYDLKGSKIYPYIGARLNKVMLCPEDDPTRHVFRSPLYPFSYSINEFMARSPNTNPPHLETIRLTQIQNPELKIMIICEASTTIDDACWYPQGYATHLRNLVSIRHDRDYLEEVTNTNGGYGAMSYSDGHATMVQRLDSVNPNNYIAYPNEPE